MLRAAGHPDAGIYPIGRVYNEARMVKARQCRDLAMQARIQKLAVSSILSTEAEKILNDLIKNLESN